VAEVFLHQLAHCRIVIDHQEVWYRQATHVEVPL
jgi:hypothetical protein